MAMLKENQGSSLFLLLNEERSGVSIVLLSTSSYANHESRLVRSVITLSAQALLSKVFLNDFLSESYQMQKEIIHGAHRRENADHPVDDFLRIVDFPLRIRNQCAGGVAMTLRVAR